MTVEGHPEERLRPYTERGVRVIQAGRERVDLSRGLEALWEMGVRRLLVEGGGTLNCMLLRNGLVDEVRVTIAPRVFGAGVSMFHSPDGGLCGAWLALEEVRVLCGSWIHAKYKVARVEGKGRE